MRDNKDEFVCVRVTIPSVLLLKITLLLMDSPINITIATHSEFKGHLVSPIFLKGVPNHQKNHVLPMSQLLAL
jgi:hypothetical protein